MAHGEGLSGAARRDDGLFSVYEADELDEDQGADQSVLERKITDMIFFISFIEKT